MADLEEWGWDRRWAAEFAAGARGLLPARVIQEQRGLLAVAAAAGELPARVPGAMRHKADGPGGLPAVGDWVGVETVPGERSGVVRRLLPRRTKISRRAAGNADAEQLVAANVDVVFVTTALDRRFDAPLHAGFLAACRDGGAAVVLLLNKLDACPSPAPVLIEARAAAAGAPVAALSARTGAGMDALSEWIAPGRTVGFVGASGVGKSTLSNRLLGAERQRTDAAGAHGRHTTTHRQMFVLPAGGILLDTPGMREMRPWQAARGIAETFAEIEALAASCRFRDCRHGAEPGCAVKTGVASGAVAAARLDAWRRLRPEKRT